MTQVYLIDDKPSRHEQLKPLIQSLNQKCSGALVYTANCPDSGLSSNDAARNSIDTDLVWNAVTTADNDSIFLLDLRLDGELTYEDGQQLQLNEAIALKNLKEKIYNESQPWGNEARNLMESALTDYRKLLYDYSTTILACAVLKARGIPCIIISGAVGYEVFSSWCQAWSLRTAVSSGSDSWQNWGDEILKLHRHPDPITRKILDLYAEPIKSDEKNAWTHGWCGRNLDKGKDFWDVLVLEDTENKTLLSRLDEWKLTADPARPIRRTVLEDVVKKFEFEFPVKLMCDPFIFPREPGIVFLLSLRALVVELGEPKPKSLVFGNENDLYYVSVELTEDARKHGPIQRLLQRDWKTYQTFSGPDSICEPIPDGGLSEAIFHFCHSRLGGIKGNEDWVKLFRNGSRKWVMWPCFTNKGITFYWVGRMT